MIVHVSGGVGGDALSPCFVPLSLFAGAAGSSIEEGGEKGRWVEGLHRKGK